MITCKFENGSKASLRHVVVDCLVLKNNKILLVKRSKKLSEGGKWALVGGFMERDETLIQCAQREILEETGWKVSNLTQLAVIDTPFRRNEDRQNISIVFTCRVSVLEGKPDWESEEIKWFDLNLLPDETQIAFDHLKMINLYKSKLNE